MSTEVATPEVKPAEPLFSKKNRALITDPLNDNNPITVQVLGICSALAITVKMSNAFVMSISVLFVVVLGNMIISALRNVIPSRIRIIAQLVIAAGLVTLVDITLKAYVYDVAKQVGVYVGLIITNCIIMGRFEAFAMGNKVGPSALDGWGTRLVTHGYLSPSRSSANSSAVARSWASASFQKVGTLPKAASTSTTT
jgi:Na+-transporting NADH:ubiquinone oxidoreductase subunit D